MIKVYDSWLHKNHPRRALCWVPAAVALGILAAQLGTEWECGEPNHKPAIFNG